EGMDRFVCRKALVADFEADGVVDHIETHMHQVGHSERSGVIVEPYLSKQWFVKMEPLAKAALENQTKDSKVNFVPERFEKIFKQWMENIEDWCISRQLWWGHQVPAWYHKETGEVYVGKEAPKDIENWKQDEDVLDTWFSSALWPFSTLDWPNTESELFKRYFPTNTLVTGYDIIFFWVSRMIFQSLEFTDQRPFKDVLIHGLIRDDQGRKMSKSLGNGVDPMDVIDQYGADTLRYFLTTNSSPGMDLRYAPEKLESTWNFINKIWNSTRFVHMHMDENMKYQDLSFTNLNLCDQWILNRLNEVIKEVDMNMDKFEFVNVGTELYHFIWYDFCSWYIELSKVHLQSDNAMEKEASLHTLIYVLHAIVRMLHPFMPFVTEEIYQTLPHDEESICIASWPKVNPEFNFSSINEQFTYLMDIVKGIREIRANYTIKNAIEVAYSVETKNSSLESLLDTCQPYIQKLCNATCVGYNIDTSGEVANITIKGGNSLLIELGDYIDKDAEIEKLKTELKKLEGEIKRCENMLSNQNFVSKAPPQKIELEKQKLEDYKSKFDAVNEKLKTI
ncbi:MAG: valine--tRNA ligase, partial [Coprobacillaceae bacterium]